MGVITSIVLTSEKAKNREIVLGLQESLPLSVAVTGTGTDAHKVIFEFCRDESNADYTVASFTGNSITLTGAAFEVNQHKNKWINIDTSWVGGNRVLLRCVRNTADTLYFQNRVNIITEYGYAGVNPCRITNIIKWTKVQVASDAASCEFEFTLSPGEQRVKTSAVGGDYFALAYPEDFTGVTDEMSVYVVLLSPWQIEHVFLSGIDLIYPNPDYPVDPVKYLPIFTTDEAFNSAIRAAIREFERETQLFLTPKRVTTNPDSTEHDQTDIAIPPLDFESQIEYLHIKLPHHHIIEMHLLEGWFGNQKVIQWNPDWYAQTLDKWAGSIQMVPMMGGLPYHNIAAPVFDFISRMGWPDYIAGFWHCDYTTGWDEQHEPVPEEVLMALGKLAVRELAPIISDALTKGMSNASVSLDGVSDSMGYTASGQTHIFSARIQQYDKDLEKFWVKFKQTEIPTPVEVI